MHFCHEEVLGLLAGLPFLRLLVIRIRNWFHRRRSCPHPYDRVFRAEQLENPDGSGGGPGWYFWDETEAYAYGPYLTRRTARRELNSYADHLNSTSWHSETP